MNLSGKTSSDILFVNFNQDSSCLAVGTKKGYRIYNSNPFNKVFSYNEGAFGIVEMLFCTSLVVLVGSGDQSGYSPRKLQIINTKRQSVICELHFQSAVLSVRLNRKRMAVVLENCIQVYDITTMKNLHNIDTQFNPLGICCLAPVTSPYLIYPGQSGQVLVFDTEQLNTVSAVQAHKSAVACMAISQDGGLLATASDRGTVIRVFTLPKAGKTHLFRRGTYTAVVCCMNFDANATMLCVSSDSDTVHIFRLNENGSQKVSVVTSYLPEMLSQMLDPERDFARVRIQSSSNPNICALLPTSNNGLLLMVITADGSVHIYNVDTKNGGDCTPLKQSSILEISDSLDGAIVPTLRNE